MNNLTNFFKDIGRWYQYPPRLALCLGGANKAIFVMNLLSRLEQTEDERGVYKTAEEIEDETGLSKYEQEGVRKGLKKLGILRETYARLDHRMYYKIDESTLNTLWEQFSRNRKNLFRETGKTCFDETGKTDFGKGKKPASLYNRSLTADHQENTSNSQSDDCGWNSSDEDENAQESTPPKPPPKPKKNPPCSPPLPDGVDPKVWAAFKEMRQKKRAYVTNHAAELIFRKLEKIGRAYV